MGPMTHMPRTDVSLVKMRALLFELFGFKKSLKLLAEFFVKMGKYRLVGAVASLLQSCFERAKNICPKFLSFYLF